MPLYKCVLCNFSSKLKTDYKRHLETKKHKNNVISEGIKTHKDPEKTQKDPEKTQKDPVKKKFICLHCNEKFSSFAHKRRHELHRCDFSPYVVEKRRIKKEEMEKENKVQNKLLAMLEKEKNRIERDKNKQIEKLEKRVDKLTKRIGNTTNILHNNNNCSNTNNNTNTNNNNIKINSYGEEE